jgi:3D (Asp-Asp-Asp) domain-containing protein
MLPLTNGRVDTPLRSALVDYAPFGDRMPLVAAALVVSTLLHAGSLMASWATPSAWSSFFSAPSSYAPSGIPSLYLSAPSSSESTVRVVFEPRGGDDPSTGSVVRWVAPHAETEVWTAPGPNADQAGVLRQWSPLQVVGQAAFGRLPVWDPSTRNRGWVTARDVGPIDPTLVGTAYLPPIGHQIAWGGPARITMYTCVELGGCNATASGVWPTPGMVAVDPSVIPLGSTVWIQGLGTFLATDTGSLIKGAHLDVYGLSYADAIEWGVQERAVLVFAPR